ncbi:MAG TPA: hypothetical protein VH280_11145 [Verrucomicrobiae bacterium]|nr:hypothetical protein [Verrucomicrobiae bacterium]
MKQKVEKPEAAPPAKAIRWPGIAVILLVGVVAFGLVVAQFSWAEDQSSQLSLSNLDRRVPVLESITNWIQRDRYCVGLSAMGRQLDAAIAPDARVFIGGMLGPTNASKTGYYFFLKNYLFPRDVEISLDSKSHSGKDGFTGVPCDSPELLRSNGFDLVIEFTDNGPSLLPLTPKGVLRSQ